MSSPFAVAADLLDPPDNPHRHDPAGRIHDRLGEHLWAKQHVCQAGGAPEDARRSINARAEWYWQLRRRFEQGTVDIDDETLAGQLRAIKYRYDRRGRIQIESKDDICERGMPSPDRADAAMMAFADLPPLDDAVVEEPYRREISPY